MFWSKQDRNCYFESMVETLVGFFSDIQDMD